jgi:hypothetical protein
MSMNKRMRRRLCSVVGETVYEPLFDSSISIQAFVVIIRFNAGKFESNEE